MPAPTSDHDRELSRLESELKRLEAEYNMFFAGRLAKPPWETRTRVDDLVRTLDRTRLQNTAIRFRFETLQSRFMTFVELWDRGQRAREEGRSGPFARGGSGGSADRPARAVDIRVLYVAAFQDPTHEAAKLADLYESLSAARREAGDPPVAFDKLATVVRTQVARMQAGGIPEVAFRVAVKDGKVKLTARAVTAAVRQPNVDDEAS